MTMLRSAVALGTLLLVSSAYAADLFLPPTVEDRQVKVAAGGGDAGLQPRERRVAIARDLLSSTRAQVDHGGTGALSLNVDANVQFDVLVERTAPTKWGYSLSGRVTGGPGGFVTLVVHDETVAGHIWTPERSYEIVPLGGGTHTVLEVHEREGIQCGAAMTAEPGATETSLEGDDGSVVDILVVWTPAAQEALVGSNTTGEHAMKAQIDLRIAFTNDALQRSGVFTSLNLVGAERVDYVEVDSSTDFARLQDFGDGYLDEVYALRDAVGADLVNLLNIGVAGLAEVDGAFSTAYGVLTFAHEIGHNFGVWHTRGDRGIFSYRHAFADVFSGNGCAHTIMTSGECEVGVPALPYYSSPALWDPRNGRPLGVSRFDPARGVQGPADAVLTINRTRHDIANFRPSRADGTPVPPSSLPHGLRLPRSRPPSLDAARDSGGDLGSLEPASDNPDALVNIPDANLRELIERFLNKNSGDPITRGDMATVTTLAVRSSDHRVDTGEGIRDLSGIEYASNLAVLVSDTGTISDLSPLKGLKHLRQLELAGNYISDLTPLADLESLVVLVLGRNYISDITPLAGLDSLEYLDLSANQISDLSALRNLSSLTILSLTSNQIDDLTPLSDHHSLRELWLGSNRISRLAPLVGLESVIYLQLGHNNISDLAPLVANQGLDDGDVLEVIYNPLNVVSMETHIPALMARGVEVIAPRGPNPDDKKWTAADPALYTLVQRAVEDRYYSTIGWPVTVHDVARLKRLEGRDRGVADLAGLESATGLIHLDLSDNSISDLSPLAQSDSLSRLYLHDNDIADLSPLSGLSLQDLSLSNNEIENVAPLANLDRDRFSWLALDGNEIRHLPILPVGLDYLYLVDNSISDIAPLANLLWLRELRLSANMVTSVDPLAAMSDLRYLHLNDNQVADISPLNVESLVELHMKNNAVQDLSRLRNAEKLEMVDVRDNPLSRGSLRVMADLRDAGTTVLAGESVPYFPAAGTVGRQGFARVVNRSAMAGEVFIEAVDDAGTRFGPVAVNMDARTALHFNSSDLEHGNQAKGLTGIGPPTAGDWRLELVSALDVEVLSYVRTEDGFVTPMHDVATRPMLPFLNPGGNERQRSFVRVVNVEGEQGLWTSGGYDDSGRWHPMWEGVVVGPGRALTLTSSELENVHRLGEGRGKWRLRTRGFPWLSMGLLESPTGHLSNLSTVPDNATTLADGRRRHRVPLFLEAGGEQDGFLRVINRSDAAGHVTINAVDDEGNARGPVRMAMRPLQTLHLNSGDLESGNAAKGLDGGVGLGGGDWRLALTSELDLLVLAYIRTDDGFVTSMHDVAPRGADGGHRVVFFNPGSNERQVSKLRLINDGERAARVTITGIDDGGEDSGAATLNVPARRALYLTSAALEAGGGRIQGGLGDGAGKWRLRVDADAPLTVMSLLESPTGHLANVSTGTAD